MYCVTDFLRRGGKRSHKGCNPDIPVLDLTIVTVKLKFTVSHISGFIMLTKGYKTNPLTDYTFEFALNLLFLSRFRNYEVQTADHNIPEHYLHRIH